jgi:hypothetical protein
MKKLMAAIIVACLSIGVFAQPGAFSLVSPANGAWANATPTFQWGAASGVSFYKLYVDGNLLKDNLTAISYQLATSEALTEALHTWYVVAVDAGSATIQSSQTFSVRVDATPPGAINLVSPADNSWNANIKPILQWSASSDGGCGLMKYQLWIDGVLNRDGILVTNSIPINNLLTGAHTWQIKAVDSVGNIGNSTTWTVKIDNVPPVFSNVAVAKPNIFIRWCMSSIFRYDKIYSWAIQNSLSHVVLSGPDVNVADYTYNDSVSLAPGPYTFSGYDSQGNRWRGDGLSTDNGYFQISNAVSGNGSYPVYGYSTNAQFTVGINANGIFSPSGNIYLSNNKPTFIWHGATDADAGFQKYQLYIDNNLVQDNLNDTFFTITTPLGYGPHTWVVRAFDVLGNIAPIFPMSFFIDNQPPGAFNLLTPLDSAVVNIPTPNLSWQPTTDSASGSGISKYQLWVNGVNNIDSIPISTTTTAPSAVLAEGSYSWYVKAFDKVSNVRTSTQTRTFFVDYNSPGAFTLISPVKGDTVKASRPKFVWHKSVDAGSGIKRYVLNISGQVPDTIASADTSAQFPTTLSNGAYTWFVVAYDRGNNSKNSDTGNFVVNVLPPVVPILATPSNHSSNQPMLLRLKWYSSIGADTYRIQVSSDSNFNTVFTVNQSGLTDTADSVSTPLTQNTIYYWRVNATNTAATSAWSEVWNFATVMPVPSAVTLLAPSSAAIITVDSVVFLWSKATPSIDKYSLEISSDSLFSAMVFVDSAVTDTSKTCKGLANKTTYWHRVKAHNSSGWGAYSDTRKFTLDVPNTAVLPKTYSFNFSGMAASKGFIRYALPVATNVSFRLFSVQGKLVRTFINANQATGYYQVPLNLDGLSRGCYLIDFKAGKFIIKKKMFNF